jgi:hypothetical protein
VNAFFKKKKWSIGVNSKFSAWTEVNIFMPSGTQRPAALSACIYINKLDTGTNSKVKKLAELARFPGLVEIKQGQTQNTSWNIGKFQILGRREGEQWI